MKMYPRCESRNGATLAGGPVLVDVNQYSESISTSLASASSARSRSAA